LKKLWNTTNNSQPMNVEPVNITLKKDVTPFQSKVRRYSSQETEFIDEMIKELMDADCVYLIHEAEWKSAVIVANNAQGIPNRLVTDLRQVNQRIIAQTWCMPDIEMELQKMNNKSVFTKIDMAKGYWQVPITKTAGQILAFATHDAVYGYKRLPQGYKNSVHLFQSIVMRMVKKVNLDKVAIVWIDDIVIGATSVEEMIHYLTILFDEFMKMNTKINWRKSIFMQKHIVYLGRHIDANGIAFDPAKIRTISELPNPVNANQLQAFINCCSFMRSVIPKFAQVAYPLHILVEQCVKKCNGKRTSRILNSCMVDNEMWTTECEDAFVEIKKILCQHLRLGYINNSFDIYVMGDASDVGYAILITQTHPNDRNQSLMNRNHIPIATWSGLFTQTEKRWDIASRELFPFLVALKKFHFILHRKEPFLLVTDNRNLSHILKPDGHVAIDAPHTRNRLYRWSLCFMSYNYLPTLIDGSKNFFCDLVSRWGQKVYHQIHNNNNNQ
jgi:hypothetical protein